MTKKYMNRSTALSAAAAVLLAAVGGCDSGLTDINRNPNAPDQATAELLFPAAVVSSVTRTFGSSLHMSMTALWVQHYTQHRYTGTDIYELGDGTVSGHWTSFYTGPQQDLREVIEKGEASGRPNVVAMATVMQSWNYHVMTDLWGDIGYSDALKGRDASAGNTPKLDSQQQVYDGILSAL